jgi:hypothetical protein
MRVAHLLALSFASCSLLVLAPVARAQSSTSSANAIEAVPENAEVQDGSARVLHAKVVELFHSGQYGQIDSLAQELRSQRVRFRGGAWQLNVLYGAIDSPGSMTATDADWQALLTKLQQWITADQQTPRQGSHWRGAT